MHSEFQIHELEISLASKGLRLDQALAQALPQYSRARIQRWIDDGAVELGGEPCRLARHKVQGGEAVRLTAERPVEVHLAPEKLPLDIVHEDDALLVLNKPAGLVVHPGAGNPAHTLQNALLAHDPALARVPRAGLVHRLDKDTSGLMVVARTVPAHTALVAALQRRDVGRHYLALVLGLPTGGGTVDQPIGRHRTQRVRMAVRSDGREAVTHYRIEERFAAHTLLRVQLETGRTHQIRVHLTHIGFPIVGDPVYGGRRRAVAAAPAAVNQALQAFQRQALHAARLELTHPDSGRELSFEVPLPADFTALLRVLRKAERDA
ncbi:MAG: 23S rRNA pseudouridine(1911/1915/1917) synthase RluD [Steroidobacteraceae bacterium]